MSLAISLENLVVRYRTAKGKNLEAVRGCSFTVAAGEVVGFLGPNGAGKSSTLKALMGFVQPASGTCQIFGEQAGSLRAKQNIGYLPEVAMYYPFLTPLETLTLYGEIQGLHGKALKIEASGLLEELGLGNSLGKQNRQLSKGLLQRVGIAQALLGTPRLLILDEVTSGLDPIGRRELREVLRARQKEGCTLFFSSHELSEVEQLCDRVIVIANGKIIDERIVNPLKEELRSFEVVFRGVSPNGLGGQLQTRCDHPCLSFHTRDELVSAITSIVKLGGDILDVVAQEGSLEDYFVETVGRAA